MIKKCILIISIFLMVALITGIIVQNSFIDANSISEGNKDNFSFLKGGSFTKDNISFSNLIKDSEVIVKGVALRERMYLHGTTLTAFEVEKAYKGKAKNSKYIYLSQAISTLVNGTAFMHGEVIIL